MSPVPAVAIALTGSDQTAFTGRGIYRGLVLRETAGAAAEVQVFDGTSAAGTLLDAVNLAQDSSHSSWLGDGGLRFGTGLFVEIVSGTVEGSVLLG